jgi:hypothetical protein
MVLLRSGHWFHPAEAINVAFTFITVTIDDPENTVTEMHEQET